jgi:hypothetical protein
MSYDPDPARKRRRTYRPKVRYRTRYIRAPRRSRRLKKIPLLSTIGLLASPFVTESGWTPPAVSIIRGVKGEYDWNSVGCDVMRGYLGYDPRTGFAVPFSTLTIFLGFIGHKIASWLGVNRAMARAPSPLNKLQL